MSMILRSLPAAPHFVVSTRLRLWFLPIICSRGVKLLRRSSTTPLLGILNTMKIRDDQLKNVITPEMKTLEELFVKNGFEIRIAGGAVRDLLMGSIPQDFDFATTATPDEMKKMFTDEGIRMLNLGGEKHGTITARINDKENFEVTALRIDMVTDGRRAEVEYTTDWHTDANRRDLTVNAMYLSFDGTVYDYFKGIEHLKERKVRFVGNPGYRIQEDYLRILRYFRFYGRLALNENSHDADILEAIRLNANGLSNVSGERLLVEFRKILEGKLYCSLVCLMHELGVTSYLGLPESLDVAEFRRVCQLSDKLAPIAMTRLAALIRTEDEALQLHSRLRLSNFDKNHLLFLVHYREKTPKGADTEDLHFFQELQFTCNIKGASKAEIHRWTQELLKYHGNETLLQKFNAWEIPRFPVKGTKLLDLGLKKGPELGRTLQHLRKIWFESGFELNEEQLLSKVKDIFKEASPEHSSKLQEVP